MRLHRHDWIMISMGLHQQRWRSYTGMGYTGMLWLPWCFLNMSRHVSMTHACHMVMSHTIRSWVMLIQQKSKPTHRQQLDEFWFWDTACVKSVTQCVDKNVMNVGFLRWGLGALSEICDAWWWVNLRHESIKSGLFAVRGFWDMHMVWAKSVSDKTQHI